MGSPDNFDMFTYIAARLNDYNLSYLHVIDGEPGVSSFHHLSKHVQLHHIRPLYHGTIIGNGGYNQTSAASRIRVHQADAISFGRPFLANPDLAERFFCNLTVAPSIPSVGWYNPKNYLYLTPIFHPSIANKMESECVQTARKLWSQPWSECPPLGASHGSLRVSP